jgi:FG-GAP repeat
MRARMHLVAGLCPLAGIQAVAQTGIFVVPPQYAVGIGPLAIAAGDFNGDGKIDLAVSNNCPASGCSNNPSTISILLGNGDGTTLCGEPQGWTLCHRTGISNCRDPALDCAAVRTARDLAAGEHLSVGY